MNDGVTFILSVSSLGFLNDDCTKEIIDYNFNCQFNMCAMTLNTCLTNKITAYETDDNPLITPKMYERGFRREMYTLDFTVLLENK